MGFRTWLTHRSQQHQQEVPQQMAQPTWPAEILVAGRSHLANIPYVLPKDRQEDVRLNYQHYVLSKMLGRHFLVPMGHVHDVLDVGCGTGIWVDEMARSFPRIQAVGLDIKLPTALLPWQANCQFRQGNILVGLPFEDASFDYVHQRLLVGAIPEVHWRAVLHDLVRVTRLGGWIELIEAGDTLSNPGPAMQQFLEWGRAACATVGIRAALMRQLGPMLTQAGMHKVRQHTLRAPLGKWANNHSGDLLATNMVAAFHTLQGFYCTTLGLSPAEFERTVNALPAEWETHHTSYEFYIAYGQKRSREAPRRVSPQVSDATKTEASTQKEHNNNSIDGLSSKENMLYCSSEVSWSQGLQPGIYY